MTDLAKRLETIARNLRGFRSINEWGDPVHHTAITAQADALSEIIAALSTAHEGMVMVPKEPTPEMMDAGADAADGSDELAPYVDTDGDHMYLRPSGAGAVFRAMIAASPSADREG